MTSRFKIFALIFILSSIQVFGNNSLDRLKGIEKYVNENYFSKTPGLESIAIEGIALAEILKQDNSLANLNKMLGVHLYFNGNYEQALSHYLKAIALYQKVKNLNGEAAVYNELGTLYRKHKRYDDALEILQKAETIGIAVHDTLVIAAAFNNIGIVYETINQLKPALKQYQKALNLYLYIKDKIGESYSLENIGGVYLLNGDYKSAELYLKKSIEIRQKNGLQQATAMGYHYLGELYQKTKAFNLSNDMFDSCIKIAEKIEYPDLIQRAYFSKANSYKALGETALALQFFERASSLKDSLFDADKIRVLSELQTQYELDVKNKENTLLKQGNELDKQKLKTNRLLNILLLIGLVSILGFAIFIYRRKQKKLQVKALEMVKEAEQTQRTRISHDLHDHVGAQLSYVVSNLDIASREMSEHKLDIKRLNAISDMSKQAIGTLRETVWALNNEKISIESFADKFKLYALKMNEMNSNIKLIFKEELEEEIILLPNTALHIFRICQEAFSNALKHANPTLIEILIHSNTKNKIVFSIKDNGKGFDTEKGSLNGHYGLANMQARAKEIDAELLIKSELGKGSTLSISLKNNTYV